MRGSCLHGGVHFSSNYVASYQIPYVIDYQIEPVLRKTTDGVWKVCNHKICDDFVFKTEPETKNEQGGNSAPECSENTVVGRSRMEMSYAACLTGYSEGPAPTKIKGGG
jgi:hypothetical protein